MLSSALRPVTYLAVAALFLLGVVDGGSVFLALMSVPDRAREVGHAAARAVEGQPANQHNARVAYDAAVHAANTRTLTVETKGFTLYPDGRVTLTATRTAPTLLLERIPPLRHLAQATATVTVSALPYS